MEEEQRLNIIDYYEEFDPNLINFIKGHLFVENCMKQILDKTEKERATSEKFSGKVSQMLMYELIDQDMASLLYKINKIRNNIAHDLYYKLTFDEVFALVEESAKLGVDYSDETIYNNKELSKEYYGLEGLIVELFPNLFAHLIWENENKFTQDEICNLMT